MGDKVNKLIVISAVWCPSCLILNKHLKYIKDNKNIEIVKYDYDLDEEFIEKYDVKDKLPVIILEDSNSNELNRIIGEKSLEELLSFIGD